VIVSASRGEVGAGWADEAHDADRVELVDDGVLGPLVVDRGGSDVAADASGAGDAFRVAIRVLADGDDPVKAPFAVVG
jgi:hypothetical protein